MGKLIAIRHGQSTWNAENRFTGWVDVDLSEKGIHPEIWSYQIKVFIDSEVEQV